MANIVYNKKSPYYKTTKQDFYLGLYKDRKIIADDSDRLIKLSTRYKYRPDLLAYDLYGDTRFWWVFIRRNIDKIRDPIYDFVPGIEIYVPTKERLISVIG